MIDNTLDPEDHLFFFLPYGDSYRFIICDWAEPANTISAPPFFLLTAGLRDHEAQSSNPPVADSSRGNHSLASATSPISRLFYRFVSVTTFVPHSLGGQAAEALRPREDFQNVLCHRAAVDISY